MTLATNLIQMVAEEETPLPSYTDQPPVQRNVAFSINDLEIKCRDCIITRVSDTAYMVTVKQLEDLAAKVDQTPQQEDPKPDPEENPESEPEAPEDDRPMLQDEDDEQSQGQNDSDVNRYKVDPNDPKGNPQSKRFDSGVKGRPSNAAPAANSQVQQ